METKFCQSCAMPLVADGDFGTNANGGRNEDYCHFCYKDGHFTEDCTMDEMIGHCLKFLDEFNKDTKEHKTIEQARTEMNQFFPMLKRWKNQ